jgi:GDPmannose 4,6-dehydratase
MNALIFGSNGQDGYYLSKLLKSKRIDVVGISRSKSDIVGDVSDFDFVEGLILKYKPSYIFHFAAVSNTKHESIFLNHSAITTGSLNIFESCRLHSNHSKIFISGSALQFKNNNLPINELAEFDVSSAYSLSRVHSVNTARYYRSHFGLYIYIGYFFNHDSPMRSDNHINQKIISTLKRINLGSKEKLEIGNLKVKKEFNFAGDIVEAVWLLVNQENIYEATIGSGKAYSIENWVEYCFAKYNLNYRDFVLEKTSFVADYNILVCDPNTIFGLGWRPNVDFKKLAELMLME